MGWVRTEVHQGQPQAEVPEWFRKWCSRLGMSPGAPDAWGTIHIKPQIACFLCLGASIPALLMPFIYIFASQPYRRLHHSLAGLWLSCHTVSFVVSWRFGPLPSGTKQIVHMGFTLAFFGAYNAMLLLMMFGPEHHCIFQSRLALAVADAVFTSTLVVCAFTGVWPLDYPKTPYRYDQNT